MLLPPPRPKAARLWPLFLVLLLLIAASGFWIQKDAWMDNRQVRSLLLAIGMQLPDRAGDWRIDPASIKPHWITRDDGTRVLLVHGMLQNLLATDRPLPPLAVTFFSVEQPRQPLGSAIVHIIRPPDEESIRQSGYLNPARDLNLAPAGSKYAFDILMQDVPDQTTDFTLLPVGDDPQPKESTPAHD
ncbi:DUF3426 domain-containing protein [Mariprofundus erugo]|uniref:DUF3426 domain-containing protein n=2 Tax=Mariprofundus erugo TaxID=2528639 RepID=A0A5R9GKB4_9PROT|nr:DUF3426 domain-containing protein [Mariprofundus erugo]TLS75699.1 DUF3426 domain-containing protein [Mariprofundus erugo]